MDERSHADETAARAGVTRRRFLGLAAGTALAGGFSVAKATVEIPVPPDKGFMAGHGSTGAQYAPTPKQVVVPATINGVIPRVAWTKTGPAKATHPMDGVSLLTFHHDGDPGGYYATSYWETAAYLERIREYHVQHAFEDIGYHYAIDRAGRVWELRSVAYRGEHVRNGYDANHVLHKWNDHNVGVVVLGNFMLQAPTEAQKAKICSFGQVLRKRYRLEIAQVKVHQELVTTECPGVQMRPYMDLVRKQALI